ncbi:MAG: DUF4186 domain-containing protein [Bacilli bacterium]|nr:DUF4186 domain-containing protein [Bacilli bacterium]
MNDIILYKLSKSKYRSSFKLKTKDIEYVKEKGLDLIRSHAYDFIKMRLIPNNPKDGKQTPFKEHPIFIAQHACACCCRGCLEKWHHIPKDKVLSEKEIDYVVNLLITWITKQL